MDSQIIDDIYHLKTLKKSIQENTANSMDYLIFSEIVLKYGVDIEQIVIGYGYDHLNHFVQKKLFGSENSRKNAEGSVLNAFIGKPIDLLLLGLSCGRFNN